jgi:transcriptional regulator with GAF, ATPase, and Fis domain
MEKALPMKLVDLTDDLKHLVQLAASDDATEDLLRRGLDWLARLAPYDLACVFTLDGDELKVRVARGPLAGPQVRAHRLSLQRFPTIREALETRRARVYHADDHAHGDGDPFDNVLDLPDGHACMVVPLCAGERRFGVLTLDRQRCEPYPQAVVDLAEVYGQLLAIAIQLAEQKQGLARLHEREREHTRLLESALGGESLGVLESSRSPAVQELAWRARQVAQTDTPVLILGETGTGKERLARAVHLWSRRADGPFVSINCAAIPAALLESELFGHMKGAFTGATRDRAGRFQIANGGTLLLDEIGELPIELQAKLLRALQAGYVDPVGSDRTLKVDVRVVAATHVDLAGRVAAGKFRADLYYRLNVFPLQLPPLRERVEDLPLLCEVLLQEQADRTGRFGLTVTAEALDTLRCYAWPGNLRELANVLERAAILCPGSSITPAQLELQVGPGQPRPLESVGLATLHEVERRHIEEVLQRTGGRIYGANGAAAMLGLKPSTLQSRMRKLGVQREGPPRLARARAAP